MIKRMLAVIAAFTLAFAIAPSVPASAAASDCPSGKFCTWNNANYSSTRWEWSPGTIRSLPNGCLNVTSSANNNASSLYNRAGLINTVLRIHNNSNCADSGVLIGTIYMDADLMNTPGIVAYGDLLTSISARAS